MDCSDGVPWPRWWHSHGDKMAIVKAEAKHLRLEGSAAYLDIELRDAPISKTYRWVFRWGVILTKALAEVHGDRIFSDEMLEVAFGLRNQFTSSFDRKHSQWLCRELGGEIGRQGHFVREDKYLNVPCHGTGHDGDPNVSIEIRPSMQEAIRKLVRAAQPAPSTAP